MLTLKQKKTISKVIGIVNKVTIKQAKGKTYQRSYETITPKDGGKGSGRPKIEDANELKESKLRLKKKGQIEKETSQLFRKNDIEENFINTVSLDWNEETKKRFKNMIIQNSDFLNFCMKNYVSRNMMKCSGSGKLLPKSNFAIDLNLPMRDFRSASSLDWKTERDKKFGDRKY